MKENKELTGTQGLIGGAIFTIAVLLSIGWIQIPKEGAGVGEKWAKEKNIHEIEACGYKFEEDIYAREACEEYIKENYYFGEYKCTDDCSGHYAGYEWAEKNGIDSIDGCTGNSQSFIEGCKVFVEEQIYLENPFE